MGKLYVFIVKQPEPYLYFPELDFETITPEGIIGNLKDYFGPSFKIWKMHKTSKVAIPGVGEALAQDKSLFLNGIADGEIVCLVYP
jgi:hypothetical protein